MFLNARRWRFALLLTLLVLAASWLISYRLQQETEAAAESVAAAESALITVERNRIYGLADGDSGLYDLYAPRDYQEHAYPILIWLHGGGWSIGDKTDWLSANLARHAAALGFVVFDVNYTLNTIAHPYPFPGATADIADFMRELRANARLAGQEGLRRISIGGHSAGAHLALYAATDPDVHEHFACVLDISGVSDLTDANLPDTLQPYVSRFAPQPALRHRASPRLRTQYWHAASVLIVHAADDAVVPELQALAMGDALRARAGPPAVETRLLRRGGHDLASTITNTILDEYLPTHCR